MPVYLVKTPTEEKLVEANNGAQAIRHVVKQTITAEVVTVKTIIGLMESGKTVERAAEDKE